MNLNNYSFEFTPTETSAGGTLLYIANHLSYKCRSDLNIYKKNELESTFIEIVNPKIVYYNRYFEKNWKNIKNTWKGIKSLISLKTVASSIPTVFSRDTITNPYDIANTFNNYFVSIAETTKKSIKYAHKTFFRLSLK